ncbi:hypothetical protein AaE_007059, partial [Aphanomyces astaci]
MAAEKCCLIVQGRAPLRSETMRSLAAQSGVPKTTIIRHMKNDKTLKAKSNYSKPYLTDAKAVHRMQYAMAFLLTACTKR